MNYWENSNNILSIRPKILITGICGAYLAKAQGFGVIDAIKKDLAQGTFPATPV